MTCPIRIGYVPGAHSLQSLPLISPAPPPRPPPSTEHFSTPLHFAQKYFSLDATLIPFPSGTGHMIEALKADELDLAIGLTEGWIAGLGKDLLLQQKNNNSDEPHLAYSLVGTYVDSPLCTAPLPIASALVYDRQADRMTAETLTTGWAISAGANSTDRLPSIDALRGTKVGVSRLGSGSHVMSAVLADQRGWSNAKTEKGPEAGREAEAGAFEAIVPLGAFAQLRDGVNTDKADFFMWEHFTSKRFHDSGEIRRLGEVYTPWSSWKIVARRPFLLDDDNHDRRRGQKTLDAVFEALDSGVKYFETHLDEAVEYISSTLEYSPEDARQWLHTVRFSRGVRGVDEKTVEGTLEVLRKAGVLDGDLSAADLIGIKR
ncbi:MAG: hypothetical protein M1825_005915 [Sarcosagium campestre]|nr:MAG: hypothetical protein M1825_005915 [Sarcosagium campestre]